MATYLELDPMKCGDLPDTRRDVKARFPKPARNISIARFHLHSPSAASPSPLPPWSKKARYTA